MQTFTRQKRIGTLLCIDFACPELARIIQKINTTVKKSLISEIVKFYQLHDIPVPIIFPMRSQIVFFDRLWFGFFSGAGNSVVEPN
ncbi:MAG: hypothetical protein RJA81_2085 [Planctomycetota bacterium]